jgi:uncharacterized protein Yka (UPF0111/DUF47 family)
VADHDPDLRRHRGGYARAGEVGDVTVRRWFLPEMPDVLGLLRAQVAVTREGMEAFEAWSRGDPGAADRVRDAEQRGDVAKREVLASLRGAFVTELEPEDLFSLSRGIDWILNYTKDLVNEAELLGAEADPGLTEMAALLRGALDDLDRAIGRLGVDADGAIAGADGAIRKGREVEHAYYRGMAALLELTDRSERISSRELYRRCERIGEAVIDVGERVVYAVVKQS